MNVRAGIDSGAINLRVLSRIIDKKVRSPPTGDCRATLSTINCLPPYFPVRDKYASKLCTFY